MIVEDYVHLRRVYERLLADDPVIRCIGGTTRGEEVLQLVLELNPDILLLDISLPDTNGLEVARDVKEVRPSAHVVILGEGDGEEYHAAAKACGASAYLQKERTIEQLVPLIRTLASHPEYHTGVEFA